MRPLEQDGMREVVVKVKLTAKHQLYIPVSIRVMDSLGVNFRLFGEYY